MAEKPFVIDVAGAIDITPGGIGSPLVKPKGGISLGLSTVGPTSDKVGSGPGVIETEEYPSFLDGIENYFTRGIIIILGFIFVAVGLSMFRSG